MHALTNFSRIRQRIETSIGAGGLAARYPRFAAALDADQGNVHALFRIIREELPANPDVIDQFLMQALRLDVQQATPLADFTYLDEHSEPGIARRHAIATAMNLPFADANSLCHLSNRHRYLYVETPKVACTAIKHSLQQGELDGDLHFHRYGDEHFPILSPLLAPLDHPDLFSAALAGEDWLRFTFVRDPFSRILSCYLDKIVNSVEERQRLLPDLGLDAQADIPTFGRFLAAIASQPVADRDAHWASQSWLTQPETVRYRFIGRLERFEDDFRALCRQLEIEAGIGAVRHSTDAAAKLAAYYGPKETRLARAIYAEDFDRFGYDDRRPAA
jgi:hypothetical protein